MLKVHSLPTLRSPVLLCALSGWPDAGQAASGALEYLIMKWAPRRFAELDPAAPTSRRTTDRAARSTRGGQRRLIWPTFACYALPVPQAPRDLVLSARAGAGPALADLSPGRSSIWPRSLGSDLVVSAWAPTSPRPRTPAR